VEFHCEELFPRVGFILTNLETDNRAVVRFYNKFFMAPFGGTTANEKYLGAANSDATAVW
jgi:hypothetical protein